MGHNPTPALLIVCTMPFLDIDNHTSSELGTYTLEFFLSGKCYINLHTKEQKKEEKGDPSGPLAGTKLVA